MFTALRLLIRGKLADGRFPINSIPRVWGGPGNGETCDAFGRFQAKDVPAFRCATCGGSFRAERTFQARDGQYYCVEHILAAAENGGVKKRSLHQARPALPKT